MAMGSNMTVADSNFDETTALNLAEIFRALSDPSRLRILSILLEQDQNVGALASAIGISIISTTSQPVRRTAGDKLSAKHAACLFRTSR